jgi:DNA-binding LacI/PurR family transcriptional regulator
MLSAPGRFSTLTQQVADAIAVNIRRGVWADQLPPERYLARSLQVSRRTLRSAIEILRKEKVLLTMPGLGSHITRASRPRTGSPARRKVVGLMMPEAFDHMKPSTMVFIDELRTLLYAKGLRLEVHVGHRYYSNRPSSALVELTAKHPADGWILIYSNPINQSWFKAQKIPAVIAGTAHEKVDLPDVDVDMFAACRHAANLFIQKGHRRLALVVEDPHLPNEKKSEDGFLEGARLLGKTEVITRTWRCPGGLPRIRNLAERLVSRGPDAASAVLVTNAYQYLALFSILTRMGVKVPGDISLISRNDEHFFQFLEPEPARYTCAPQTRARAVLSALMRAIQGEHLPARHFWLVPDFITGATVAAPRSSDPLPQ